MNIEQVFYLSAQDNQGTTFQNFVLQEWDTLHLDRENPKKSEKLNTNSDPHFFWHFLRVVFSPF